MEAGKLNKRIELWSKAQATNELLEKNYEPQKLREIWCEIIPQTGSMQRAQADTILSTCTHKVVVRFRSGKDIRPDMWFMFRGQRFDIKYILNPYFRDESLEIFVEDVSG